MSITSSPSVYERNIYSREFPNRQNEAMNIDERFSTPNHRAQLSYASPSRLLHGEDDIIISNGYHQASFHPPVTRKVTKVMPKENYSLSNARPNSTRRASTASLTREVKETRSTTQDAQRLKKVRRHEPAQIQSGSGLITPESWRTDPVVIKAPPAKPKPVAKPKEKPVIETPPVELPKPKVDRPKRERSASRPKSVAAPPVEVKPPPKQERPPEEKQLLKKYIEQKRQKHDEDLIKEKQQRAEQEKQRKEKLKQLSEQTKKVAQQPLPAALVAKKSSAKMMKSDNDKSEERNRRMLDLLGPPPVREDPREFHNNTPFDQAPVIRERSPSSSSSSSSTESVVEVQPARATDENAMPTPPAITRREIQMMNDQSHALENRRQNILRWALNLNHGCADMENKIKYLRPDGTQRFDIVPPSFQQLQNDSGNLRVPSPIQLVKPESVPERKSPSKVLRPSGQLSQINRNPKNELTSKDLPGIGNLRDPALEQLIRRDRAASKIQALYRGYTVRKSLEWIGDRPTRTQLNDESNRRVTSKSSRMPARKNDLYDQAAVSLNLRFSDDQFTFGSTLLRHMQGRPSPRTSPAVPRFPEEPPPIQRIYSDDYESETSTTSSMSKRPKEPSRSSTARVVPAPSPPSERAPVPASVRPQPKISMSTASSTSASTSSSTSTTPTPTPVASPRRRSSSPPLPPMISPDNGRPILAAPPSTQHSNRDERRYSPDALERQLNAELHLLDGVEASMKQLENMERLRSVTLAQQEVVSLAQILKDRPVHEPVIRRASPREVSSASTSSSSTTTPVPKRPKRRSPSPTSSSSESTSTASEKRRRAAIEENRRKELEIYEKRLQALENKLKVLADRAQPHLVEDEPSKPKKVASVKSSHESSISEDLPGSRRSSSSTIHTIPRRTQDETSEIQTEIFDKDEEEIDESSSASNQYQSDFVTSDVSEIRRRIPSLEKQLQEKKKEVDRLKKEKDRQALKRKEEELKNQLEDCDKELKALRTQPTPAVPVVPIAASVPERKVSPVVTKKSPIKDQRRTSSSSSTSSSPTPIKAQESSIAEELPAVSTTQSHSTSQSKSPVIEKPLETVRPTTKAIATKRDDFFDDDEEEEEKPKKEAEMRPVETPRDERDTHHDALSISIATDIAAESDIETDSRRPSSDMDRPVLNFNRPSPSPTKEKDKEEEKSETSSSTTTSHSNAKVPSPQPVPVRRISSSSSSDQKQASIHNDYDEDFSSDASHSTPVSKPAPLQKVDSIDVESIQEDLEDKHSAHKTDDSVSSKSSGDEQSEILVLVKKSANTTPRRTDDKTWEDDPLPIPVTPIPIVQKTVEPTPIPNDDTSHDVTDDDTEEDEDEELIEQNQHEEQEKRIDRITDQFIRTFIDEAIDQSKEIDRLKKQKDVSKKIPLTKAVKEWILDDDDDETSTDEDHDDDRPIDSWLPDIPSSSNVPATLEKIDDSNPFQLDLSHLDDKNADEPRVESPRKITIEEPVKPLVPHTPEQVTDLCHQALDMIFNQNDDFTDRSAIQCHLPETFFATHLQNDENEDIRRNHHAYCQMIVDLCIELVHEMHSANIQSVSHPDWQKSKLIPKRFYRGAKPRNRQEIKNFIPQKVLEILNLKSRATRPSKWRVAPNRNPLTESFEIVLDEEIRRTESQWLQYDDDLVQVKLDTADAIMEQLVQDTITQCLLVVDRRRIVNSHSTRL